MLKKYTLIMSALLLLSCSVLMAQIQIQNGGLQSWSGFNLQHPDYWTTTEQAMGMKANKFVWKEGLAANTHAGTISAKLYSDTTSASATGLMPGMLTYGQARYVNNRLVTSGLPVYGRPISLSFYIKIYHPVPDTASVRILLTRWNVVRRSIDTVAYERRDIFPDSVSMDHFALFTDSLNYLLDGEADTARIVIYGGRRGGPALLGNTAWIDDIVFNYPGNSIVHPDVNDEIFLYPNPAYNRLSITANESFLGYTVILMDHGGIKIKEFTINDVTTTLDVSNLNPGSYCYAVLDTDKKQVKDGNINIERW